MKTRKQSPMSPRSLRLLLALMTLLMVCGVGWQWLRTGDRSHAAGTAPAAPEFVVRPRPSVEHPGVASVLVAPEAPSSQPIPDATAPAASRAARSRSVRARAVRPLEAGSPKPAAEWDERISIELPEAATSPAAVRAAPPKSTASTAGRLTAGDL